MSAESLARLKEAVQGKTAVNQKKGRVQTASIAEVSPFDVMTVCDAVRSPTKKVADLLAGNHDATEESPNVFLHTADVLHLIEQAEKSE
jgi:hypothetical protein